MKNEKEMRAELKHLIRELKAEIKENNVERKAVVKARAYDEAAHLQSVNGALDYVIGWLNKIVA